MSRETQTYRVWLLVPVEVEALDEINAEQEALDEFKANFKPRELRSMIQAASEKTQILTGDQWEHLI